MSTSKAPRIPQQATAVVAGWADRINAALEANQTPEVADMLAGIDALMAENDTLQSVVVETTQLLGAMIAARYMKDDNGVMVALDAFMQKRVIATDAAAPSALH